MTSLVPLTAAAAAAAGGWEARAESGSCGRCSASPLPSAAAAPAVLPTRAATAATATTARACCWSFSAGGAASAVAACRWTGNACAGLLGSPSAAVQGAAASCCTLLLATSPAAVAAAVPAGEGRKAAVSCASEAQHRARRPHGARLKLRTRSSDGAVMPATAPSTHPSSWRWTAAPFLPVHATLTRNNPPEGVMTLPS